MRILACAAALLITLLPLAEPAFADPGHDIQPSENTGVKGGAYEVTSYDLTAEVGRDHTYTVEEKISVIIPDTVQRVEFAIPSGNFRMSDIVVEDALYEVKTASEASTVVISDPEKLTKGAHTYTIKYKIHEYQDRDSSKDMFYFKVMLPEWRQPVANVNVDVSFPDDFPFGDMQCYAGQFGVQDSENKITFRADAGAHKVSVTGSMIPENFGITLKAQLPDGYWEDALDGSWSVTAIALVMAGLSLILLVMWIIGGRDPKVRKEAVSKPVEGIEPIEIGYILNGEVRTRDVLLMIIQFAQKGYLSISEYEPKHYRLIRGGEPAGEERMYRNAYNILFEDVYKDRALGMEKIGPRIEKIRAAISDDVAAGFTTSESSAFTPVSRAFRAAGALLLGIALGLSAMFSYYYNYKSPNIAETLLIAAAGAAASPLLSASSRASSRAVTSSDATCRPVLPLSYISWA